MVTAATAPTSSTSDGITIRTTPTFGIVATAEPEPTGAFGLRRILRNIALAVVLFSAHKPELVILMFCLTTMVMFGQYSAYVVAFAFLCYLPTYSLQPHLIGHRRKRSWVSDRLVAWLGSYLNLTVVRESNEPLDPKQRYLFGYAPHAWIPMGMAFVPRSAMWNSLFPEIQPRPLTSSIIHFVPGLRDYAQHLGAMEASKRGFNRALNVWSSAVVVPGGQQEMIFAAEYPGQAVVCSKHKGFVRVALRRAAKDTWDNRRYYLVPVYCFGEARQYRNPLSPLGVQKWCVEKFRSNFAFLPLGRYWIPSFPVKEKMTVVVGDPILVPRLEEELPTNEQVECLHRFFYSELNRLFDKYKHLHKKGYEKLDLRIEPPVSSMTREEFAQQWAKIKSEPPDPELLRREAAAEDLGSVDPPWKEYFVTGLFLFSCSVLPYLLLGQ